MVSHFVSTFLRGCHLPLTLKALGEIRSGNGDRDKITLNIGGQMNGMNGMMNPMGMAPMHGLQGMQGNMMSSGFGMNQPGYGAMGMPGAMANNMGMMNSMNSMGMGGMGGMGAGMNPMMHHQMGMGMNPMMMQGGYGNPNNEAQAGPVSFVCARAR